MASKEENAAPLKVASISVKTVGYSPKELRKLVDGNPGAHFVARVGGVAAESFSGTNKNGEWHGFKGIFTLINRDKQAFTSTAVYLPANITKKLLDQLANGVVEVEFLADIYVQESDKVASGYGFICEPVMGEAGVKKAAAISERVLGSNLPKSLALAAPSKKSA